MTTIAFLRASTFTAVLSLAPAVGGQTPTAAVSLTSAEQNGIVQRRCASCHTDASPKGGLSLEHFDIASPDPAVAQMMLVKISADGAISAAGQPVPDKPTTAALVAALTNAASQTGPWIVELTEDPLRPKSGHALVTARHGESGPAFSCNGAARVPRLLAGSAARGTEGPVDFEGLSPTVRQIFAWCLGAPAAAR